ncbi:LysM peptidoglycan-binding domain-containing protein [Halobacillus rhizosphaerae]|uniref:LysM peptidoglycan-binding and 3D domain-containing protein n=1 Tax=Halobacillus rhizosphaerae TaxID=3064889 RepID=UPI00398A860A
MKKTVFSLAATVTLTGAFASTVSAEEYTIDKGDTLWGISKDYNVSVDQLKTWNDLNSNLIYPNQKLTVSNESNTPSTTSNNNSTTYTVQSGDTLYAISQKYGVSVDQLMAWNNLSSTMIYPGDKFAVKASAAKAPSTSTKSAEKKAPKQTKQSNQSSNKTAEKSNTQKQSSNTGNDVVKEFTAQATAYTASCAGCSGVTATGIDLNAHPNLKVIAVDPNVIPLGSKVYVEGYGVAIAGDTGGAINGSRIDVYMADRQDALAFGRKDVKVQVLAE